MRPFNCGKGRSINDQKEQGREKIRRKEKEKKKGKEEDQKKKKKRKKEERESKKNDRSLFKTIVDCF